MRAASLIAVLAAIVAAVHVAHATDVERPTTPERRALATTVPEYPKKARRQRLEGDVKICYWIDAEGRVSRARVAQSSHRLFNRAALRAARDARFEPALPGAANARTINCSTFRFRLSPPDAA